MKYLARLACATGLATACNTESSRPGKPLVDELDAADDERATVHGGVAVSVGARDGEPRERFSSKDEVFLTSFMPAGLGTVLGHTGAARDYFFRVVDGNGVDVSRSDAACRRVRIGKTGQIETLYTNGDDVCPHAADVDREHGAKGVTVGLAPFGDAAAILDGVAIYEVQLSPVERFTGFHEPTFAAQFVLDMRIAVK